MSKRILILTLDRHKDGVWVNILKERLEQIACSCVSSIEIVTLESLLEHDIVEYFSTTTNINSSIHGIVNRISDACSPTELKQATALLGVFETVYEIPVFNGAGVSAFSLCANKWCHHVLFQKAGLLSPPTASVYLDGGDNVSRARDKMMGTKGSQQQQQHLLFKPNAGGFGKGIVRLDDDNIGNFDSSDGMGLIQQYIPSPVHYRVWFLCGKVQCGVERRVQDGDEFTGACAASSQGACSRASAASNANSNNNHTAAASTTMRPYRIPRDVVEEIEQQLLPLLPDAHAGSVEFMIPPNASNKRLYYDLNLLSTLPVNMQDPEKFWRESYDPWMELAQAVMRVFDEDTGVRAELKRENMAAMQRF